MNVNRLLAAIGAVSLVAGTVGLGAGHASADEPVNFAGSAQGVGVEVIVDRTNQLPFNPTAKLGYAASSALLTSNNEREAIGAFFDPGALVLTGPRLLPLICEAALQLPVLPIALPLPPIEPPECPALPPEVGYPFYAKASGDNPGPIDTSLPVPGSDPNQAFSVTVGQARAAISPDGNTATGTSTMGQGSTVSGGVPISIGSSVSTSTVSHEGSTVKSTSVVELKDVNIAGALVIGSMRTVATATGIFKGAHDGTAETTFGDVTLVGQPATIDNTGIHFAGQSQGGDVINQAQAVLDFVLSQANLTMALAQPRVDKPDAEHVNALAGGVLLRLKVTDPKGETVTVSSTFGAATAKVSNAIDASALVEAPSDAPTSDVLPFSTGDTPSLVAGLDSTPLGGGAPQLTTARPATNAGAVRPVALAQRLNQRMLKALYSLVALMGLACLTLAAWRAHAAAADRRLALGAMS